MLYALFVTVLVLNINVPKHRRCRAVNKNAMIIGKFSALRVADRNFLIFQNSLNCGESFDTPNHLYIFKDLHINHIDHLPRYFDSKVSLTYAKVVL